MKTRQQYLNGEISFHDYYLQFATEEMKQKVKMFIGIERIKASKDEHLSDIPLKEWDALSNCRFVLGQLVSPPTILKECSELLKEANEQASPATMVCIYKAIARELIKDKVADLDKIIL